jgi:phosphatidylserine/phosphatidylglycerophosphate/cardiolipin synthase-like enzyme
LYTTLGGYTHGLDFYTLWAIIKAVQAGVNVQIVISNEVPAKDGGYTGFLKEVHDALGALQIADRLGLLLKNVSYQVFEPVVSPKREDIVAWASASLFPPVVHLPLFVSRLPTDKESEPHLQQLTDKLQLAPLYYAPDVNYWKVGTVNKPAANHAKVYIIDDTHFYVGSDNMYLSGSPPGLQEYGYLIEGKAETQQFISQYWEKLWENSQYHTKAFAFPATTPGTFGPFLVPVGK